VEKNELFYKYGGEKRLLSAGEMPTIVMDREFNYGLVLPLVILVILVIYEIIRRKKVLAARALQEELESSLVQKKEAERRDQHPDDEDPRDDWPVQGEGDARKRGHGSCLQG
jgi:hypothetical protein